MRYSIFTLGRDSFLIEIDLVTLMGYNILCSEFQQQDDIRPAKKVVNLKEQKSIN